MSTEARADESAGQTDKGGRPTLYRPEYARQAKKLCELGATDAELADFFGVEVRTIYRWKAEHKGFCQALKSGKDEADERVERALYARATGYEHDEIDIRVADGEVVQTPIRRIYPPDTTAAIFWLKNRRRNRWRERVEHGHGGIPGSPIEVVGRMTREEKDAAIAEVLAAAAARRDAEAVGEHG